MTKNLVDNIELPRFTARSGSMAMRPNESHESVDSSVILTSPLHSQTSKEFKPAEVLHQDEYHINTHTIMPERIGQSDRLSENHHVMRNQHILPLALCNNPDCTQCPAAYKAENIHQVDSISYDNEFYDMIHKHVDGRARKLVSFLNTYLPIVNPHNKVVQWWNKFFVISCLVAIFVDPLFFFLLTVEKENKCVIFHWPMATSIAIARSVTDFFYLLHMFLQFRLTYVAPESTVFGAGDLVSHPKKIALNYLRGYFLFDLFVVLPLPQVMILIIIPNYVGSSTANYAKNLLRITVLLQYVPRIIRFVPLLGGQSTNGFIFESAWANFVINLLMFILAGHVVGSCWYLFGLQRVNQCLHVACSETGFPDCKHLMDCGRGSNIENTDDRQQWINDTISTGCFNPVGHFDYGIYQQSVLLTTEKSVVRRYIYALFWGFQQISTLAGNQAPSYFEWEVLFTMAIIGLGLLLFALLIGNMQNFLQALGKRRLDMQLRRHDVEQWMRHRRLPEELRRKIRQAERFNWAATRGVNEEELLANLPEDIQKEIRQHFFESLHLEKYVSLFTLMDKPIMDAISEKLKQKVYIRGSKIFHERSPLEKMVFIVRGEVESKSADGSITHLSEGEVCGQELLPWCLTSVERVTGDSCKIPRPGERLFSERTVSCLTNVEAFVLTATDLVEVTTLFSRFFQNPHIQGLARYESSRQRIKAATTIQVAWRKRLKASKHLNVGKGK